MRVGVCCCLWFRLEVCFTSLYNNSVCSHCIQACPKVLTSRSDQQGISLWMSTFWWTSQDPWLMTLQQFSQSQVILVSIVLTTRVSLLSGWVCMCVCVQPVYHWVCVCVLFIPSPSTPSTVHVQRTPSVASLLTSHLDLDHSLTSLWLLSFQRLSWGKIKCSNNVHYTTNHCQSCGSESTWVH